MACHEVQAEMEMEEVHRPTGGPWGSDYIDGFFDALLDEIFGDGTMRVFRMSMPSVHTKVVDNFRKSKMQFYNQPNAPRHAVKLNLDFIDEVARLGQNVIAKALHIDDEPEQFRETLENATPFGLPKGHFTLENDTMWMSREIWANHLFDRIIDPMIEHVQDLIEEVNEVEGKVRLLCHAVTCLSF